MLSACHSPPYDRQVVPKEEEVKASGEEEEVEKIKVDLKDHLLVSVEDPKGNAASWRKNLQVKDSFTYSLSLSLPLPVYQQ